MKRIAVNGLGRMLVGLLVFILLTLACSDGNSLIEQQQQARLQESLDIEVTDSAAIRPDSAAPGKKPLDHKPSYSIFALDSDSLLRQFRETYDRQQRAAILALNRLDHKHLRLGDSLVVPDSLYDDFLTYSPFPANIPALLAIPKLIMYSYRIQAFAAYNFGKQVHWGPTSMGKKSTPTPTGLYFANWRARLSRSSIDRSWVMPWNVNIDNFRGIAMHQYDLPGRPASHGCCRLLRDDARWIYEWVDTWILRKGGGRVQSYGTPVVIFGAYDYKAAAPWKSLTENAAPARLAALEVETALQPHLKLIRERSRYGAFVSEPLP